MRVLVTGATGFIGSHTAIALQKAGHDVRLLVRNPEKASKFFAKYNVSFDDIATGDITSAEHVEAAVIGCDAVVHTAALVATGEKFAELVENTNVNGTKNVVSAAIKHQLKKIIHVSSVTALYDPRLAYMDEETPVSTLYSGSPYGRSKMSCEIYLRELQAQGHPIIITYPGAVIGPDAPAITEPHEGLMILLKHIGLKTTSGPQYIDVRDLAEGHVKMIDKVDAPDRFIFAGYQHLWMDLPSRLNTITGNRVPSIYLPKAVMKALGHIGDLIVKLTGKETPLSSEGVQYATEWVLGHNDKALRELDMSFRDPEDTLRDTIKWLGNEGHISEKQAGTTLSMRRSVA